MMRDDPFRLAVQRLFARLSLPEPRFDGSGSVRLRIEGTAVDLADDDRGLLRIEALAGLLPEDPVQRQAAIDQILRVNAGLLIDIEVGTYIKPSPDGRDMVCVEAHFPYFDRDPEGLVSRIEDVLRRIEIHRAAQPVGGVARTAPPTSNPSEPGFEQALIFRP
ncbi:hypothetical protein [Rhizobium oryzicola]|uniref:Uncharacterized protein n=1 Tax=Rhizobium oryzicola TaxID=1232668 RepID=A0ABT8SXR1_9HYPH|nr:hypothetical protein [Rhizobium oryzicola]MDO1583212.1 hypothetical protein [Rhizobium oryzicola]